MAIITISREMGSGGIPIVHGVAERLGYTLVDRDAILEVAEQYGLSPEDVEKADEKPPAFVEELDKAAALHLHTIELIILDFALKGNIIIYGRGGQDLLRDINSAFRVRITAPFEERVERWAEREWLDPDLAHTLVRKSDQQRAGFIKYYFDRDWDDPLYYDLTINTSRLSEETAVNLICDGVNDPILAERKEAAKLRLSELILQKKIEITLAGEETLEGLHINIQVHGSTAELRGHVHSNAEHQQVVKLVRETPGIDEVLNRLKVIGFKSTPREH